MPPNPKGEEAKQRLVPFMELFRYATSEEKAVLVAGLAAAVLNGAALPLFTIVFGALLDDFGTAGTKAIDAVRELALYLIAIAVGMFFLSWLQVSTWKAVGHRLAVRLREIYLRSLLDKDVPWYDLNEVSRIAAGMENECMQIQEGSSEKISMSVQFSATFISGIIVGLVQGWQLALVTLSLLPLIAAAGGIMGQVLAKLTSESQGAYSKAGAVAHEVFGSIRTVTSFNAFQRETNRYNRLIDEARQIGIRKSSSVGVSFGAVMCVVFFTYGLSLWYGGKLIADGTKNGDSVYTGGDVISVFFAVIIASFSIGQATPNIPAIVQARAVAHSVFCVIDASKKKTSNDGKPLEKSTGSIYFKNVAFHYPSRPSAKILHDLTIHVNQGETVALVGESGSGKSTVINLLERFYTPSSGNILLDDVNISDIQLQDLRQSMGLVSQEPVLFHGTIRTNIMFGQPNASRDDVVAAAKAANAHSFITRLPNGYDTMVEGSTFLSGGQKQRIAIARAILKNPTILLLDEATSLLDNESEAAVQKALDNLSHKHTTLIVAHRLSTIRHADRIYVIHEGRAVEEGTHEELLALQGRYFALVQAQTKSEQQATGSAKAALNRDITESENESIEEAKVASQDVTETAPHVPLRVLVSYLSDYRLYMFAGILGAFAYGAAFPGYSLVFSEIIAIFYDSDLDKVRDESLRYSLIFYGIGVGILLAALTQSYCLGYVGEAMTYAFRADIFKRVTRQHIGWFEDPANRPAILSTRLATDAEKVRILVVDRSGQMFQALSMVFFGLLIAFIFGWELAFTILAVCPLVVIAGSLQMKFFGADAGSRHVYALASTIAVEGIENIRTVKSFNSESAICKQYSSKLHSDDIEREYTKALFAGIGLGVSNFVMFSVYAYSFSLGAIYVDAGLMSFDDVLRVFFGIIFTFMSLGQVSQFAPDASGAHLSVNAIFQLKGVESKIDPGEKSGATPSFENEPIVFENVVFRYPTRPDTIIFAGLSFTIQPGKTFAMCGPSGSGKSTVLALLQRFYDPESGCIRIGGTDLVDINVFHLREQIAIVSQEPQLFNTTIYDNILYGRQDATKDEVAHALEMSNAAEFVARLPDGAHTVIGEKGIQLSGGQRQRIAIARALLRDPKILLLDEATSALDFESEKFVQEALDRLMKGRTTIIVAHRLSTIQSADTIAVVEGGCIVESGDHEELMQLNSVYAHLVSVGEGKS